MEGTARTGSLVADEIADQPAAWRRAAALVATVAPFEPGVRTAIIGCGSSWHAASAIARLREGAQAGETDAYPASEAVLDRGYGRVIAISRSGRTSEVLDALERVPSGVETVAMVGDPGSPVARACSRQIDLAFADDRSVVQTRFVTTAVAFARAALGTDLEESIADARTAIEAPPALEPADVEQLVFLGRDWCVPIASAAALVARETAQVRTEAHPAMEYRHGPIATAGPGTVVWFIGAHPDDLPGEIEATGATILSSLLDPLAELVLVQRLALFFALRRGLDPDRPPNLTRAVVLDPGRPEEIVG